MKYFEIIERYFDGNMTSEELSAFESSLKSNSELQVEYNQFRKIHVGFEGLRKENEMKVRLQKLESKIRDEESIGNPPKRIGRNWLPWMSAASVLAAAFIGLLWIFSPGKKLIDRELLPREMGLPVTMGNPHRFDLAMNQFKENNFEQAAKLLLALPDAKDNDTVSYYLGLCNLHIGKLAVSQKNFLAIKETSTYYFHSGFYSGLLAFEMGNEKAAKSELSGIAKMDTSDFGVKARLILSRIASEPKK